MSLSELFPVTISRDDAVGGPGFQTDVVIVNSGDEFRNRNWAHPLYRYQVSHDARVARQFDPLPKHFINAGGMENVFPFKDWADYICVAGDGFFVTVTGGKQMVKRYTAGSSTYDRVIRLPVNGTITLTGGGTIDYNTGIVAGGTPTAWHGEFYVPCRYDTDRMEGLILEKKRNGDLIMGWRDIPIVEVRETL